MFVRLALSLTLLVATAAQGQDSQSSEAPQAARNVILIIGDGMDDHQITIARNYLKGAQGKVLLDELPVRSTAQVLTITDEDPGSPVYVADSANSATSIATGVITSRGRIATTAGSDKPIETIAEQAIAAGMRAGVVATSSVTDATPSSFVAHINQRFCQNPSMMVDAKYYDRLPIDCSQHTKSAGGLGSISEQLAASKMHVILGGGQEHFDMPAEDSQQTVRQQAVANGFNVVDSLQGLNEAPADQRLLGIFSEDTMPVRLAGEDGREAEPYERSWANYIFKYFGTATPPAVMECVPNPEYGDTPPLKDMTAKALEVLSHDNDKGFFLMVESASIDKESHKRKPCGSIGELEQLLEVLELALDFAETNPNTLVLVTADHGQAAQLVPNVSLFAGVDLPSRSPGLVARIRTPEGSVMAVNYATNNLIAEEHTGVNVPLFANSEGAGLVAPMVTQPDIYHIMADYLGLPKE